MNLGSEFERKVNQRMDNFCRTKIESVVADANQAVKFGHKDLDKFVNDEETLREYLNDGIAEFHLQPVDLDSLTDEEVMQLLDRIDSLWRL